jgi:hypothetical protein
MSTKINLLGILIKPVPIENNGGITFEFHIARGSPANPLFFTSPALVDVLSKLDRSALPKNSILGKWEYFKERYIPREFPLFEVKSKPFRFVADNKALLDKGIAPGLEEKCFSELKRRYGQSTIIPFWEANEQRMKSLIRSGISVKKIGVLRGKDIFTYEAKLTKMLEGLKARKRRRRRLSQLYKRRG